jgi:hypothetical protein
MKMPSSLQKDAERDSLEPWAQWMERVEGLTERLKKALFRLEAAKATPEEGEKAEEESKKVELSPEDRALSEILLGYLKEMRQEATAAGHTPAAPPRPPLTFPLAPKEEKVATQELDEESTLPFGIGPEEGTSPLLADGETGSGAGVEEEETLIVSSDLEPSKPGPDIPGPGQIESGQIEAGPTAPGPTEEEEEIPETVILGPGSGQIDLTSGLAPGPHPEPHGKSAKDHPLGQHLGKTPSGIAPSGSQGPFAGPEEGKGPAAGEAQGQKRDEEDEFLAETVILTPQDLKPPKKDK